jgi:hypothetical protein
MTNSNTVSRAYSLVITIFLFLIGLGMGLYALGEDEGVDRLDDFGLLAVGLIAVLCYLAGRYRFKRSVVPLGLTLLALAVQVLGVVLELGDRSAFGDNAVGMVLLVPLTLFALWQYFRRTTGIGAQPVGEGSRVTAPLGQTEVRRTE